MNHHWWPDLCDCCFSSGSFCPSKPPCPCIKFTILYIWNVKWWYYTHWITCLLYFSISSMILKVSISIMPFYTVSNMRCTTKSSQDIPWNVPHRVASTSSYMYIWCIFLYFWCVHLTGQWAHLSMFFFGSLWRLPMHTHPDFKNQFWNCAKKVAASMHYILIIEYCTISSVCLIGWIILGTFWIVLHFCCTILCTMQPGVCVW